MKNVIKKFFALATAMSVILPTLAQEVDEVTAQQRALSFLQKSTAHMTRSQNGQATTMTVSLAHTSRGDLGNNYYAYNVGNGEGFIVVSADDRAKEILGYADNGSFNYATIPANVKWWLSQYDEQIALMRKSVSNDTVRSAKSGIFSVKSTGSTGAIHSKKAKVQTVAVKNYTETRAVANRQDISPMIKTKWDQHYPYNSMIPTLGAEYTGNNGLATGCAATAIAQILNFYKYPTPGKGTGSNTYTKDYPDVGNTALTFSADFANATYDWDNMLDTYDGSESQASKDAVGTLMYHVGVANNMNYGLLSTVGSGAIVENIPHALINYLGIDKSTTCENRMFYTTDAWEEMVYAELSKNRPVLYSGITSSNEGHTFICDGYSASDNHYHINWGWSGMCDGYYVLTATTGEIPLQPTMSGSGGAGAGASYSDRQVLEKNFFPDQGGDYACCIMNYDGYQLDKLSAQNGDVVSLTGGIFNMSLVAKQVTIGLRFTNVDTGENVYYELAKDVNLAPNQGCPSLQFQVSNLANGKYAVCPVYYETSKPGEWIDVLSPGSAPVLTVGMNVAVETIDKSRLYLKCDALSILEPTELAGASASETKEYILNRGTVPMIKIQGCVYADNCINEATLDYGFGIFKDGTLIATEVLSQYFAEGSSYYIFSPLSGYFDAPGTYTIKMIYRYQNEETYHFCYGANFGYVEIINDGTKLTASLKNENDLSNPNICMTNAYTFIVGDDTNERNSETGDFDLLIEQNYWNRTSDMYYFDMGLALLKNGEMIKTYPIFESNSTAPNWGWSRFGNIQICSDIADGQYQIVGVSKLHGVDEWRIGEYEIDGMTEKPSGPIDITISNGTILAKDSRGNGQDINPPACMTLSILDHQEKVTRSSDGNFYFDMKLLMSNENDNAYFFDLYISLLNENKNEVFLFDRLWGYEIGLYRSFPKGDNCCMPNGSWETHTYCFPQDLPDGTYTIQGFCKYVNSKKYPDWRSCPNKDGVIYNVVIKDNTLTLAEVKSSYNLTYKVDGEDYMTVEYDAGATITPEPEPTKLGYTFSGWSEIPTTMPEHDVVITGSFIVNSHTVTFRNDDGSVIDQRTLNFGAEVVVPDDPTKPGYKFTGWKPGVAPVVPDSDLVYTATYKIDPSAVLNPDVEDGSDVTEQNVDKVMDFNINLKYAESIVVNVCATVRLFINGILKGIAGSEDIAINEGVITIKFKPFKGASTRSMTTEFWQTVAATGSEDVDVQVKIDGSSFKINGEDVTEEINYNYKTKSSVAEAIEQVLSIDRVGSDSDETTSGYDINGRRINVNTQQGVIIKDGNKVMIK